ncbi:MAG TPA: menaquinone biosynthesis protein [Dissulfurispiraceae bacterium]|nr:menaquinone biosynthesis protein [Dissulfurispiraceae bacterium]
MRKLRIGKISYANIFPIFYLIERKFDCSRYEFVEAVPSELNRMLQCGEVDISPSSSVEYLRNPDQYSFMPGVSISSRGAVGSVFLFSRIPIDRMSGKSIAVTKQSATSVVLLEVLLRLAGNIGVTMVPSDRETLESSDAFLLIGDDALLHATRIDGSYFVYDLGDIWDRRTGLPFVFALWIYRRNLPEDPHLGEIFRQFADDVLRAKKESLLMLPEVAVASPLAGKLSHDELLAYWKKIDYELDNEHLRGLQRFRDLAGW